jgi:hypothetical protein
MPRPPAEDGGYQIPGPPTIDPTKLTTDAVNAAKEDIRRELAEVKLLFGKDTQRIDAQLEQLIAEAGLAPAQRNDLPASFAGRHRCGRRDGT